MNQPEQKYLERKDKGGIFEEAVFQYVLKHSDAAIRNGVELNDAKFVQMISKLNSNAALFIRYAPDGLFIIDDELYHWEAKRGYNIEKDAYETYCKYQSMGCKTLLIVEHPKGQIYKRTVECLKFCPSLKIIENYTGNVFVDDEGWIHNDSSGGSGKPYRAIDFKSMRQVTDFA